MDIKIKMEEEYYDGDYEDRSDITGNDEDNVGYYYGKFLRENIHDMWYPCYRNNKQYTVIEDLSDVLLESARMTANSLGYETEIRENDLIIYGQNEDIYPVMELSQYMHEFILI